MQQDHSHGTQQDSSTRAIGKACNRAMVKAQIRAARVNACSRTVVKASTGAKAMAVVQAQSNSQSNGRGIQQSHRQQSNRHATGKECSRIVVKEPQLTLSTQGRPSMENFVTQHEIALLSSDDAMFSDDVMG